MLACCSYPSPTRLLTGSLSRSSLRSIDVWTFLPGSDRRLRLTPPLSRHTGGVLFWRDGEVVVGFALIQPRRRKNG
jgi:hypothetical protein